VDRVVSVLTLCTIPAVHRALAGIRRVLRPAGAFHFMEHGLSPPETAARWQHRLTPLQRRVFGGCHINRPIGLLVAGAGLELTQLDNYYLTGRVRSATCSTAPRPSQAGSSVLPARCGRPPRWHARRQRDLL